MRILVLTPTFFPIMGGAELGIYTLCRYAARAHAVCVLAPRPSAQLCADYGMEENCFDMSSFNLVHFADRFNLKDAPGQRRLRGRIPPFSLSQAHAALRQARSFRPDVVLAFYALPSGLAAACVRKRLGIPVVLSIIGRDVPGPGIPEFWKHYVRWSMRRADHTLFISDYCRQAAGADPGFPSAVIPFGVDPAPFALAVDASPLRDQLGIPREANVLLALQRLDPWKQVDVLIRAMGFLRDQPDVYLVIGGKGPELPKLKRIAEELGLTARVRFTGYIPDSELPVYYALADVFVFHSTYETFCLSLLQAMAAGKPIVSVGSTAIPELVRHGENGLLVAPGDAAAFAGAVLRLLADGNLRERFAVESRRRVRECYDWELVGRRYVSAMEQCLRPIIDKRVS